VAANKVTDEALHALARTQAATLTPAMQATQGIQGSRSQPRAMVTSGISCAETTTEVAQKAWQKR
jgi:hypothetical protein